MAVTRKAAEALSVIRSRARLELGDSSSVAARQKYTDANYNQAINDALCRLHKIVTGTSLSYALAAENLSYTADAEAVTLPSDVLYTPIYEVEDITTADTPLKLKFVPPNQIEDFRNTGSLWEPTVRAYTLTTTGAAGEAGASQIRVRPIPGALTLRIWYLASPLVCGADGDVMPILGPDNAQLVGLMAARSLASIDDEFTAQQETRYAELLDAFIKQSQFHRGMQLLPRRRRWRS